MEKTTITVDKSFDGRTVKELLYAKGYSVAFIKNVKIGGIFLGRERVTVRKVVHTGDVLELISLPKHNESIPPIDVPVGVLYEDDYIVVFDKPTNMPTHPSRGNSLPTLANAAVHRYGTDFVFRSITRLDRDTSGIVLVAKDQISAGRLSADMKSGKFLKKYLCTVCGVPERSHAVIDAPIRREAEGSIKRTVAEDGKRAVTEYTVISSDGEFSECEIILHTGRTHQIRVHMAYIGHPLKGDFLYGTRDADGYMLRCVELSFPHPNTGEIITVRA